MSKSAGRRNQTGLYRFIARGEQSWRPRTLQAVRL
jgi:hypothetical protein